MIPSTILNVCLNKKNSKLILQIDFSQMDKNEQAETLEELYEKALLHEKIKIRFIQTTETKNELTKEEFSNLLKKENND
ncbi:hypothetical protein KVC30_06795 [Helicobacter pylori]|nr:hypothetical protein KVC30_06795 [Helicobacter pylori]WQT55801.1 hypothetical protein KVE55_04440 [Helicobacter pylori]WQT59228.1 hypothetical protein E5D95_06780 [Helicobacter pylori]WQT69562.1 hypothetical protein E5D91_06870 [Helicobacter pylori]